MRHTRLAVLELNEMRDFVVYCFCVPFNIPLPVSTRKKNIARRVIKQFQSWAKFSWRKRLTLKGIRTCTRADKTRHEQGTLYFNSWMGSETFYSSLCQTTEAQNLNAFFMTLWEARKPCEAKSKATIYAPHFSMQQFVGFNWKIFFRG